MPIEKMNTHYSLTNPASIYNEEALTALELAARTTGKVNETVEAFNNLESETNTHLSAQDTDITKKFAAQDKVITERCNAQDAKIAREVSEIPVEIENAVKAQIALGNFDKKVYTTKGNVNYNDLNVTELVLATGTGCTNNPDGKTPMLVDVQAFGNRIVQQAFELFEPFNIYYRVYSQDSNGANWLWSPWKSVNAPLKNNYNNNAFDLNTLAGTNESWYFWYNTGVKNFPEKDHALVQTTTFKHGNGATYTLMTWHSVNNRKHYYRMATNNVWDMWVACGYDKQLQTKIIDSGDMNALGASQIVIVGNNVANIPENRSGLVDIQLYYLNTSSKRVVQIWRGWDNGTEYYRVSSAFTEYLSSATWSEWYPVTTGKPHPLAGKTVVFLGDSVFANDRTETGIVKQFAKITGAKCYNFAFGGTRACTRDTSTEWYVFDGEYLTNVILGATGNAAENDLTWEDLRGSVTGEMPSYFSEVIEEMATFDWSTVDFIVYNWGTNDFTGAVDLDHYGSALAQIAQNVSVLGIPVRLTPTFRNDVNYNDDDLMINDYATYTDTDVNFHTRPQTIDLYYGCGFSEMNISKYMTGAHPTAKGAERIAVLLAQKIG